MAPLKGYADNLAAISSNEHEYPWLRGHGSIEGLCQLTAQPPFRLLRTSIHG